MFELFTQITYKINIDTFKQCVEIYYNFIIGTNNERKLVLDAKPGHGKTTALYCLVNYMINHSECPLLLVFKEIEQQTKFEEFLLKLNPIELVKRKILNVNQEENNINSVNESIQIISITHARLENLIIGNQFGLNKSKEDIKKITEISFSEKRKIIIDEEPNLFYFEEFRVDDKSWIDEELIKKAYNPSSKMNYKIRIQYRDTFTYNTALFQTYIRCMIQLLIVQEQLANTGIKTKALIEHQPHRDRDTFNDFFDKIEKKIESSTIFDSKFIKRFMSFKKLYYKNDAGFFTPEQDKNPKTIIVADKLNFDLLDSDILIMDGTASYFPNKYYALGFQLCHVEDYINYSRVGIILRNVNTSSSSRTSNNNFEEQILHDISEAKSEFKLDDIPYIPTKANADKFKVKIEENSTYDNMTYVFKHIFNTRGSNELKDFSSLYLTALPIKPPNYYRSFASVLYGKDMNYKLRNSNDEVDENYQKAKNHKKNTGWFFDERIQEIYVMDILNELIQIIMRTDLRNLYSDKQIKIFIATTRENLVKRAFEDTEFTVIKHKSSPTSISMQIKIKERCNEIRNFFDENDTKNILPIGQIGESKKIQAFINNQYENHKEYFDKKLKENNLELIFKQHGTQLRKYIKNLS